MIMHGRCDVINVACFFIAKGQLSEQDTTHLKLQKLVYYAQGFTLALYGDRLFDDKIEAWRYGPVCPRLYEKLKRFSSQNIRIRNPMDVLGQLDSIDILDEVWSIFGHYDGWKLVELTHLEDPWIEARRQGENTVITDESMKEYFRQYIVN